MNFPQQFTPDELLPFLYTSDRQHPQYFNLLDFPSSHFTYLACDSKSLDKSPYLPPPVRPYTQQHHLPPPTDTTSNVSIQTLPSSSNAIVNLIPPNNQHIPTSNSQVTVINDNLPTSHSPNHYTTPSNTPPAVSHNPVPPSTFSIPTLPPIPLSLNNTLPTQPVPQNPPPSSTHDPSLFSPNPFSSSLPPISSISQTTTSTTQPTSYNPFISLYPTFQNFPTHSFQSPPNPPHPTLPTSTLPFNSSSLYSSPPFPTAPSVPFAALSDPIKLFDGLDHTYPPEKLLAHLSDRVTFQLGPQPVDIQSYLTWYSRRMSLLYCSLTGTASNWYDRLPQVYEDDWSSFLQFLGNNSIHRSTHIMLKLKLFHLLKRIMKMSVTSLLKSKPFLNKAGTTSTRPLLTSNVMKFSLVVFPTNQKFLPINAKLNIPPVP